MVVFVNNSFSAFKLFYDEFVYKKSSYVSYAKVEENLFRIGLLLNEVRHFSKLDVKAYMKKLNKATKDMKFELEEILVNNKHLMEYYRLLYNSIIDFNYLNSLITELVYSFYFFFFKNIF